MQGKVSGALLGTAVGACLVAAVVWMPRTGSEPRAATDGHTVEPQRDTERVALAPAPPARRARAASTFDRYHRLIKLNPFHPRLPKAADPSPTTVTPAAPVLPPASAPASAEKPATPSTGATPPPVAAAPPDPLKDWTYVGTVAIGPDVYAVVENKASKQGRYVRVGENFEGAVVEQIGQSAILVSLAGASRTLTKSSTFNATPLNASAPGGGTGAPGGPGTPGGPPGARPGTTPPGAPPRPGGPAPSAGPSAPVQIRHSVPAEAVAVPGR